MYTLRKVSKKSGAEINISLGNEYTFINSEWAKEEFKRTLNERVDWKDYPKEEFYGYVANEDGSRLFPLFKCQFNYIMTESGSTFANLTFK